MLRPRPALGTVRRARPSADRPRASTSSCRGLARRVHPWPRCPARARPGAGSSPRAAREESARSISRHGSGAGNGRGGYPCRASSCRSPGARGGSRTGADCRPCLEGPEEHDHARKAEPVAELVTSGVIRPRSSAITGRGPSSAAAAPNTAAPGPGSQRPERASGAPSGIAQNSAKPRKWSSRARSKSASVRRRRSIHQR